jgi:hypothetical protein
MRVRVLSWVIVLFASLPFVFSAVAQERTVNDNAAVSTERRFDLDRESEPPSPPAPPLLWARASIRGPVRAGETPLLAALDAPGPPSETTVVLPLSAGLSVVSLPLRAPSEKLSDIFPNLPEGTRAWVWDVSDQKFVEGLDSQLPLGHACWLYVPVPVLLVVTGRPNRLQNVSVDLERGWNLIGVPYGTALLRSQQQVYVNWARKPLNNAVAAGDVGPSIFSFDVNGYETVAEDGSFAPLHGYWVYARGAELLELERPGLSDIASMIPWGSVLSTAGSLVMTQMGYGDTAKLNQILAKLDNITQTQAALDAKLDTVLLNIEVSKTEILESIGDTTYVAPVQVALLSHYDQENPNTSLAWFVAQARAGTGPSVPMATRSTFARQVLNDWKFIDQFNLIKAGIAPVAASDKGLLDNFADHVVLTSGQYDLKDRYVAMETYFSTLVGMQIKCATLIMNAYDQLGNDPASTDGYTPRSAADWKTNVFDPVMKAETERFLQAVEGMAVKKLPVPQSWSDPAVELPDYVQVVMGLADLYVMETLKEIYPQVEPPGVRVRIVLNPGAGGDLPRVAWIRYGVLELPHITTLPSFDSWQTYTGAREYDDWTLSPDLSSRVFKVTSNWRMVRVILPVTNPATVFMTTMGDSHWWAYSYPNATVSAVLTESGTLFGSITLARRPTTRDVFDPCMDWPSPTINMTHNCGVFNNPSYCDQGGVVSGQCNSFYFQDEPPFLGTSWMTLTYQFSYQGDVPKAGTWKALGDGTLTFPPHWDCFKDELWYQLFKGNYPGWTTLDSTKMIARWYTPPVQTVQVTWEPGQIYTFQAIVKTVDGGCTRYWHYGGAAITVP